MENKKKLYRRWVEYNVITDQKILNAFLEVPRENFVLDIYQDETYGDYPLPIGSDQTISQPTTVMMMLELLELEEGQKVLEIGAGSGYNASLLATIAEEVYTVERIPKLFHFAQENLKKTSIHNATVILGDGKQGYSEEAPYDRIIIAAAASEIPEPLLDQLKIGGILVLPLGPTMSCEMIKIRKISDDGFEKTSHGLYSFVPLV